MDNFQGVFHRGISPIVEGGMWDVVGVLWVASGLYIRAGHDADRAPFFGHGQMMDIVLDHHLESGVDRVVHVQRIGEGRHDRLYEWNTSHKGPLVSRAGRSTGRGQKRSGVDR